MTYCSHCGSANKDRSKFCSNCSAPLAALSTVRCAVCGTHNATQSVSCRTCGSRLDVAPGSSVADEKPTPPRTSPSVPSRAPDLPPALSAWVKQIAKSPPQPGPEENRAQPEWLVELESTALDEQHRDPVNAEPAPEPVSLEVLFPEWLIELQTADDAEPVKRESTVPAVDPSARHAITSVDLPEWLPEVGHDRSSESPGQDGSLAGASPEPDYLTYRPDEAQAGPDADAAQAGGKGIEQGEAETEELQSRPPKSSADGPESESEGNSDGTNWPQQAAAPSIPPPLGSLEEELPAWLAALMPEPENEGDGLSRERDQAPPAAPEGVVEESEPLPNWLREFDDRSEPAGLQPEAGAEPTTLGQASGPTVPGQQGPGEGEGATPADLRLEGEILEESTATREGPLEEPHSMERELPAWLDGPSLTENEELEEKEPAAGEAIEIPSWVLDLARSPVSLDQGLVGAAAAESVPDDRADQAPAENGEPAADELAAGEETPIPTWLMEFAGLLVPEDQGPAVRSSLARPAEGEPEAGERGTMVEVDPDELTPAWMQGPGIAGEELAARADAAGESRPGDELTEDDLPDWLKSAPGEQAAEQQLPAPLPSTPADLDEVPKWISALRPVETLPELVETSGPLAGVRGVLPAAQSIAAARELPAPKEPRGSGGRVFEAVLAGSSQARSFEKAPAKASRLNANRVIYLLIMLVAIAALLLPPSLSGIGLSVSNSTPTAAFYDKVHELTPASTVLISFDYEPGQAVELTPAVRAVLGDLAARGVNVLAISTSEAGSQLAQIALYDAANQNPTWRKGYQFVNIGYVPGAEAGLRHLAESWFPVGQVDYEKTPLAAFPLTGTIRRMGDLDMVIEVAGSEQSLRWWMEQVQPLHLVTCTAITSAGLETPARNYVNSKQLAAFLRGLAGAAEYELFLNQAGPTVRAVDAQSLIHLVIVGVVLLGNVLFWASLRARRRVQVSA